MLGYKKYDEYYTPKKVWQDILPFIPHGLVWEPFYGSGGSTSDMKSLGLNVVSDTGDFFGSSIHADVIVTNPPFSIKKQVLCELWKLQMPFIMVMPLTVLCSKMYKPFFDETAIIIPSSRIDFLKDGQSLKTKCPFDSVYYCWKIPTLSAGKFLRL
jgi:hypothetical protein